MENLANSLPIYIRIVEGVKDAILEGKVKEESQLASTTYLSKQYNIVKTGALTKLIEERRKVFKERYIVATLKEAKRLNYSEKELQELVKEAFMEIK